MRFIQYARKSSEGDERQVQSIPDQKAVLSRIAEHPDVTVVTKLEESQSAKQPGTRPLYREMIDAIKANKADGILCWHLNRLSRNPVDSGELSWLLQQGIIRCIKTPEREYLPEDNVVIMAVENAVANQYIVDLRKNIRRAQLEKAARGWYPHKPPSGYFTNRETGEIEVDPKRFDMLRKGWELMLSEAYTVPEVLEKLREWGFTTRRLRPKTTEPKAGKMITRSNLYKLFDSRFYLGEFSFLGETYQGRHKPMITRAEFERVQEVIHKPVAGRPKRHYFAFSGLMRCGGCGCLITAERKIKHYRTTNRTVTYTYYRCTRSKRCTEPPVTEGYVDEVIRTKLVHCSLDPDAAIWAKQSLVKEIETAPEAVSNLTAQHSISLDRTRGKLDQLYEMRLNREIESEDFKRLRGRLQGEISRVETCVERLMQMGQKNRQTVDNLIDFMVDATTLFDEGGVKDRRQIAQRLAQSYVLKDGLLSIQPHRLLEPLLTFGPQKRGRNMVGSGSLSPQNPFWCARRDLNPRPSGPKPDTLSTELRAQSIYIKCGSGVLSLQVCNRPKPASATRTKTV